MAFIELRRQPSSWRVYVGKGSRKYHLHHGADGLAFLLFGLFLMWHDRKDYKEWFPLMKDHPSEG